MKRICFLIATLVLALSGIKAIPAHPGALKVQQPDGSYVTIRLHGDEWLHFNTTDDGYSVVKDSRGYYVYAQLKDGRLEATSMVAHDAAERQTAEQQFLSTVQKYQAPEMTAETAAMKQRVEQHEAQKRGARRAGTGRAAQYDYTNFKGLIILVEYNDKQFSRSDYKDIITNMANQENYTGYDNTTNGRYTGSVRDYFSDNSAGKFQPQFDVVGPYTVNYSQYYPNGSQYATAILNAAINAADAEVDFSQYDGDGDGVVDMVYFIVAGNGANYQGNDERLWWPHRSVITNGWSYVNKDGVRLWDYASSVELAGYTQYPSTVMIDGIGTICHEFSHVLGLPDFYDADYEESGGESNHPGIWSIMAGGSYENNGRTPVGYSLYERWSVGFIDDIPVIDAEGSYTLNPLYSSTTGYRINTPVNNEFFLLENRQQNSFKWDKYLPGNGMLVHRVDLTNQNVWNQNTVNNNPNHNYYEVLRAGGTSRSGTGADLFPGTRNVRELHNTSSPANLKTWAGKSTKWGLKDIKMANGVVTFNIVNTYELASISLPATLKLGLGLTQHLEATPEPSFAEYTLTWASSDESVATVDQEGNVKGTGVGTAVITVTSNNNLTSTCQVTVVEIDPIDVAAFKQAEEGTDILLKLEDAEVLYVYQDKAYIRDAKGSILFSNIADFNWKRNDIVNGTVVMRVGSVNNMVQAVSVEGSTNSSGLTVTQGDEVQPREVKLEDLTEADYADYVVVKAAQLERNNGVWAVSGNKRVRLFNVLQISGISVPSNVSDKYFDIHAIFATNVLNGNVIDELEMLSSPMVVTAPEPEPDPGVDPDPNTDGIVELTAGAGGSGAFYNLQGQRVSPTTKGLLIRNGRKIVKQ